MPPIPRREAIEEFSSFVLGPVFTGELLKLHRWNLVWVTEAITNVVFMGFFASLRAKKAASKARAAADAYAVQYNTWKAEDDKISEFMKVVVDCIEGRMHEQLTDHTDYGFMLNSDEIPVAYLPKSLYLEVVRAPSSYSGGYGGVSFPLFGGIRLNTGRTGGKITPGQESIDTTDEGPAMVTTERIMFAGSLRSAEWKFSKMLSVTHSPAGYSVFAMSGNRKPAGIAFGPDVATEVQFRIELGAAIARNRLPQYLAELQAEKAQHDMVMPVPPPPPAASSV